MGRKSKLDIQRAGATLGNTLSLHNKYGTGIFSTTVEQTVFTSVYGLDLGRLPSNEPNFGSQELRLVTQEG